jgi:hypothetical protein
MQVKVKKEVLFNLLKNALNENRTSNNPSGNFIHAFDRKSDSPITASPHMATQLSVEQPPVEDENYVPASISELKAAAARIAQEVPPDQVEGYYRALHRLLDAAIDKSSDMMSESRGGFTMRGIFSDDDADERYGDSTGDDEEGFFNVGEESLSDEDEDEETLLQLKKDPLFQKLSKKLKKDPIFDGTRTIQKLSDKYGVGFSKIEGLLFDSEMAAVPSGGKDDNSLTGQLALEPTTIPGTFRKDSVSKVVDTPEEIEDTSEVDDDYLDRAFSGIKKSQSDELEINRETESLTKRHRALTNKYWKEKQAEILETTDPVDVVAQTVMDSMDAVSRTIATEVSVKFGFLGADIQKSFSGSPEEKAWGGILTNNINTNNEVIYTLSAEQKTDSFWKARVTKFINKFQSRNAGSLSSFVNSFVQITTFAADRYEDETGKSLMNFLDEVVNKVVDTILRHPVYGATTRNISSSDKELLFTTIDTGFSAQIKKAPFKIPNRTTFAARVVNGDLDPNEIITHAGQEKSTRDAIVDAVVAYVIIKSAEFKKERKDLDPELSNEAKDAAIQQIVANLKDNQTFTYTEGAGENKQSFVISKDDIFQEVNSYVDQKFVEAGSKDSNDTFEEDDAETNYLEDPSVSEKEKKERFTDEVASQIMRNTGSVASYRDYFNRVIMKKFDFGMQGLKDLDDFETQDEVNLITIFNDTLAEILPSILKTLEVMTKELVGQGLSAEDLEPFIEAIAQIRALEKIVYSKATRGGESTIQNLSGNKIKIDDEEYDAFDFFSEGSNTGPAIIRQIVSDIIGASLKGSGIGNIETINFKFEQKVKRQAENVEAYLLAEIKKLFSGIDLKTAQDVAYATGTQIGLDESKAKFLEPNGRDLQLKMIYPFVGRVKKMPDFRAMNPPAKNFVCWFSAVADKQHGGAATMDERKAVAENLFNLLMKMGSGEVDNATKEVEKIIATTEKIVSKKFSELESLEDFSSKEVKRIRKDPNLMKQIVKQAMKMHLDDVKYFEDSK